MKKKYIEIYRKYEKTDFLIEEIVSIINKNHNVNIGNDLLSETTNLVVAPTFILFVYETMIQAKKDGVERLYFLARDGFIFYEIAKILNDLGFEFDIRYLYCSRTSLRKPLYYKFDNFSLDLMFSKSKITTIFSILKNIGFETEEIKVLYKKLDVDIALDKELNEKELNIVKNTFEKIKKEIFEKSKDNFNSTIGYFEKNGLLENVKYGIVDSGWNGSMQESINRLIKEHTKKDFELFGYYFGIFKAFRLEDKSKYRGWYFDSNSKLSIITKFNINLFESLTAAPHGMTLYYDSKTFEPVLKGDKVDFESSFEKTQYELVINMSKEIVKNKTFNITEINSKRHNLIEELLTSLCFNPSYEECMIYGNIEFSDAPTEENMEVLCRPLNKFELLNCLLPIKLFVYVYNRIFINKRKKIVLPFWTYGAIKISNTIFKKIYLLGFYQINYIYAIQNRRKQR